MERSPTPRKGVPAVRIEASLQLFDVQTVDLIYFNEQIPRLEKRTPQPASLEGVWRQKLDAGEDRLEIRETQPFRREVRLPLRA